jgi:hypothetical protein
MSAIYSGWSHKDLQRKVFDEKTTLESAIDNDLIIYYRANPCKSRNSHLFYTSSKRCRVCSTGKAKAKIVYSQSTPTMLSIDDKLEDLRLARELRDYE